VAAPIGYPQSAVTQLQLTGIVTTNDVVVGPQIGGRIDKLLVNEGDTVKAGQLVAVIAPTSFAQRSAYATQNSRDSSSQIQQAQRRSGMRSSRPRSRFVRLNPISRQPRPNQAAATADLESARPEFFSGSRISLAKGVAAARTSDDATDEVRVQSGEG